ncbi:uncharacterized protein ACWYII_013122 [Salvelinus alpinus]
MKHMPWSQGLLGLWPARPSAPSMPNVPQSSGKRLGVRIDRVVRTPGFLSQPPSSSGGAHRHRRGSKAPLPPEADEGKRMEPVVVVGRTCVGDFCHVPVTVEGVPCSALVDTGSTVTLVRPDIVPGWTQCEPTTVQLRTVTATSTTQPSVSLGRTLPAQLPQMGEERTLSAVREIWGRNCVGLDPEQQERLGQLLFEFRDSFVLSEEEVGQTHLVQHEIDTGDARPIKMRPRCIALARQEAADKAVLEMQRADFIEPSDSPWAAPVVLVPKKGGKLRFCADYRRLNEVTRKDSYPIPSIDESLYLVRGCSWFSSLDLRSGYWQVPLLRGQSQNCVLH